MGKGTKIVYNENLGKEYGKSDLDRLGLFVEMPYMNGQGYKSPFPPPNLMKGATFLPSGRKTKNGTQHGYFDSTFKRIYEGEAYPKFKMGKNLGKTPFIIGSTLKKIESPGHYFGTFAGKIEAFSNRPKPNKPYKSDGLNFVTHNGKHGGPGYADICINKYPEHLPEPPFKPKKEPGKNMGGALVPVHYPQPYFDKNPYKEATTGPLFVDRSKPTKPTGTFIPTGPGKWQGGCHGGCFNKFPEHMPCKYVSIPEANKPRKPKPGIGVFTPGRSRSKTLFTFSIMQKDTDIGCNATTYKSYQPKYTQHLLDAN